MTATFRHSAVLIACIMLLYGMQHIAATLTCTHKTMEAGFVGGGYISGSQFITAHNYEVDSSETRVRVRSSVTGNILSSYTLPLASIHAITCPPRGLTSIALTLVKFASDGTKIVQPYLYNPDGSEFGKVFRSTYVYFFASFTA
jgi:hypothetical protein